MQRYDGRVAVVTGASSGIGRRVALDLAARGATVIGLARREALLAELRPLLQQPSPLSDVHGCDVADIATLESRLRDIDHTHGRIDVLVNNAGIDVPTPVGDNPAPLGVFETIMATNYFAVVASTLAVLPGMLERRSGVIVNVSSDSARAPEPRDGGYAASKAAVSAFTESVAHEIAGRGVHVHVLYPAWVPTAMGSAGDGRLPPKLVRRTEALVSNLLLEHMGGPRIDQRRMAPEARRPRPDHVSRRLPTVDETFRQRSETLTPSFAWTRDGRPLELPDAQATTELELIAVHGVERQRAPKPVPLGPLVVVDTSSVGDVLRFWVWCSSPGDTSRATRWGAMDRDTTSQESPLRYPARVSKAAGMVSTQVGCDVEQALVLMLTRAASSRVTVDDLADAVIDGSVRFDS